ncbi:MAG: GGDEF domain-containing protein, partial [Planctomycetota bacterium]
ASFSFFAAAVKAAVVISQVIFRGRIFSPPISPLWIISSVVYKYNYYKMGSIDEFLKNRSNVLIFFFSLFTIFAIGAGDYLTGPEISFSIFYLCPIALAAWYCTMRIGILTAFCSAVIWFIADKTAGREYEYFAILYWNAFVRFWIFFIVVYLLSIIHTALEKNKEYANTDFLTKICNIRQFYEKLKEETERARRYNHPISIAYMDLDNFKNVNDQHGHKAGDELLKKIGAVLKENVRATDIVARLGGDEFAVLLPEISSESALEATKKLQKVLLNKMKEENSPITFSIGLVTFIRPPDSVEHEMLKRVDKIMYSVKENGKNNIKHELEE